MADIVLLDGARTAHGSLLGGLSSHSAIELGTATLDAVLDRTPVAPDAVDWVALGCAIQAGLGQVPARQAVVASRLSDGTPATTINEASGSGLRAIALAADRIEAGRAEVALAGGMESMTNAPYVLPDYRTGRRYGDATLVDSMIRDALWDESYDAHMGELTEALVEREGIPREAQDEYALESNRRAVEAVSAGRFDAEVVPVEAGGERVETDEGPREDTSMERLAGLPPAFGSDGTITAGNASKLSDGAGCVALATADAADDLGVDPLARVVDYAVAYRDPKWFNVAVADAVEELLAANDLAADDVARFELNEAFAAQMVYVIERLGIPRDRLNTRGGAVAFGHPIGASGGMLATSIAYELREADADYGVVGMSIGGGGGIAMLLSR
ncbi:thiolase family protein [Halomarina halobia]|uniref:Thiolase family protein n=1 Tax=Halomarina halobia TaxID=3033386 RepID=A0ABD6ABI0_9EURY|nr:thiolase family protein [Halomarina sp. PSR21]